MKMFPSAIASSGHGSGHSGGTVAANLRTRNRLAGLDEHLQREWNVEERPQAKLVGAEIRQRDDQPLLERDATA
eukprot:COSAG06_NODE_44969_length_358_cov_4.266409_1_plen_73_part_10